MGINEFELFCFCTIYRVNPALAEITGSTPIYLGFGKYISRKQIFYFFFNMLERKYL